MAEGEGEREVVLGVEELLSVGWESGVSSEVGACFRFRDFSCASRFLRSWAAAPREAWLDIVQRYVCMVFL